MAYFIPSYFQKRLLRYALSRLDFLNSEALDLENLDITFGQRSVIELKNVGIKTHKLVETLQIPPAVVLRHASVRNLRITVPADLHVSGIVVEVDGVEIKVHVDDALSNEEGKSGRKRRGHAVPRGDAAARPRIASPSIYDPGGPGLSAIPTSEDLAMSFLQTEPEQEKQELQAVIQSHSVYLQQSSVSLASSEDDTGIGMPGGLSLPSFVANFFSGIADRLSVQIKNVRVTVGMQIKADSGFSELLKIQLRIQDINLEGLKSFDDLSGQTESKRSVSFTKLDVLLLSEAETFSQRSTASSPKLSKSYSKASSTFFEGLGTRQSEPGSPTSRTPENISGLSRSTSNASSELANLALDASTPFLESSQLLDPSTQTFSRPPQGSASVSSSPVDNRRHAERLAASDRRTWQSDQSSDSHVSPNEELSESRMFTHDEAESMYMSAVSNTPGTGGPMPGAWDEEHSASSEERSTERATPKPESDAPSSPDLSRPTTESVGADTAACLPQAQHHVVIDSRSPQPTVSEDDWRLISKRIFFVDRITIRLPSRQRSPEVGITQRSDERTGVTSVAGRQSSRLPRRSEDPLMASETPSTQHNRSDSTQSTHGSLAGHEVVPSCSSCFEIDLGNVLFVLDTSIIRILVKASVAATQSLQQSNKSQTPQVQSETGGLSVATKADSVAIRMCQTVPSGEDDISPSLTSNSAWPSASCEPLLLLTMSRISHQVSLAPNHLEQQLIVNKITLGRGDDLVVSFFDPAAMQTSVTASTVILEPNDLVFRSIDHRLDVTIRPIHVSLDLLLVDDVLSRSGGLSSLLDLGNSIASTGTVKEGRAKVTAKPSTQRTVRFDRTPDLPQAAPASRPAAKKINLRLGGTVIELVGSESSIQVRSSAVKTVVRGGALRTQISTIVVKGPLPRDRPSEADVYLELSDLQFKYTDTPEEEDLDRLLSLLTPSGDKYDPDDDIMVDTLLRQRRKGGVVQVAVQDVQLSTRGVAWTGQLTRLGDELSKLSSVTKYLPEDDRPGVLTFLLINRLQVQADLQKEFGLVVLKANLLEGAQISLPSLLAAQVSSFELSRPTTGLLLHEVVTSLQDNSIMGPPMVMCRFIADEMEPTVKVKLANVCVEYQVPVVEAVTKLADALSSEFATTDAATLSPRSSSVSSDNEAPEMARKVRFSLAMRNSAIALNPDKSSARGLFLLTDAMVTHSSENHSSLANLDLKKASVLVIDDQTRIGAIGSNVDHKLYFDQNDQIQELTKSGYVPVGSISAAFAEVKIIEDSSSNSKLVDVEFRNNLLFLETCADSTQTLIQILSGLAPPSPPSKIAKFRTEIVPIEDMLASFTGNAFVSEPGPELGLQANRGKTPSVITASEDDDDDYDEDDDDDEDNDEGSTMMGGLYASQTEENDDYDRMTESYLESEASQSSLRHSVHVAPVSLTADESPGMEQSIMANSLLDFRTDHFANRTSVGGTAHRWNSTKNTYEMGSETSIKSSPLKLRIRDVHIIWNLFDGYDWQATRDAISQAVQDIETKVAARQSRRDSRRSPAAEDDEESVVGDVLFNSIYISIPAHRDPRDLTSAINQDIGDLASETESYATSSTVTATPRRLQPGNRPKSKRLKLNRSKQHKMTFELEGLSADLLMFPPKSGEVESSVDIRVRKLEVFDHVPTSTWKKFATYLHEAGERELGTDMVHIELLNVKPVAELAASEMVLKLTVLPLRLHVDQDALDFLTRFFEFKDDRAPVSTTPSTPPFIQRAEVLPIRLCLDFKPKRVDYAGLRSGRTSEFMNFLILDRANMVLRRVILYGVSGLDRLGIMLNNIWTPDVKKNQLPGVLAGLAPVRSFVDVGSGVKDLIAVPIREYKKDGRIVRSIQKGALAFAKTTTTELVNLGAKLAIGTQTVLQNAEEALVENPNRHGNEDDDEDKKQISLYADQPLGIVQGLRGAYASLERDLLLAKDAIVAVPGEIMATGSAAGAARVVLKQSPTIILRPAIGVTKAMGQAFLGAGNTLDKTNRRRVEDKYKRC